MATRTNPPSGLVEEIQYHGTAAARVISYSSYGPSGCGDVSHRCGTGSNLQDFPSGVRSCGWVIFVPDLFVACGAFLCLPNVTDKAWLPE